MRSVARLAAVVAAVLIFTAPAPAQIAREAVVVGMEAEPPGLDPGQALGLHTLRVTAQLAEPFLPETSRKLLGFLAFPESRLADLDLPWGTGFTPGHRTLPPEPLFPRVESA